MFKHVLEFEHLVDKQDAIDIIIEGQINLVGDVDECLTLKQVTFLTDIELTREQRRALLVNTGAIRHTEEEI